MKKVVLFGFSFMSCFAFSQVVVSDTIYFTGSIQTWTVPCGVSGSIHIDAYGAQGDTGTTILPGTNTGGLPGLGNRVSGDWSTLTVGDVLDVYVGGQANGSVGGFNGGGNGVAYHPATPSGGGGGATDIRMSGVGKLQVAGGGGGGGNAGFHAFGSGVTGGNGGNGGGNQVLYGNSLDGSNGQDCSDAAGVYPGSGGGTTSGAGIHGIGCGGFLGADGTLNSGDIGGNGGVGNFGFGAGQSTMAPSGGGGGGGYIGGNGGGGGSAGTSGCSGNGFSAGGGGSAGSNWFDGADATDFENGVRVGNGLVVFTYTLVIDSAAISAFSVPCALETETLTGTPASGTWSITSGPSDITAVGVFSPTVATTFEIKYTAADACGVITSDSITITVDCVLGIEENVNPELVIFPNPATSEFSIKSDNYDRLTIIDVNGQNVKTITEYQQSTISLKGIKPGVYFVIIEVDGHSVYQKLIVE